MKKIITLFSLLIFLQAGILYGQTFHAIIFANTKSPGNPNNPNDTGIGPSVTVDFQRMSVEMTTIAKSIGYELKKYYYYDTPDRFNRNSLENVLTNLSCSPNDIVFFFYSGHGGRAVNETTIFPEMVLKVPYGPANISQLYPLYDVYTRLKSKSPRLVIVMGDMCNSIIKGYYRENEAAKKSTTLSKGVCDVYQNLFLNVKGGLIVASSEPGKTSGCHIIQENGKWYHAGGYLTFGFLGMLQYCVSQEKDVSWNVLLDNMIEWTKEETKDQKDENGHSSPQIPIYKSELVIAEAPYNNTNANEAPHIPTESNDPITNENDKLGYLLSMTCNQNISRINRIRNIPQALNEFTSQARVQVVGFDNRTIVNTSYIKNYLNYISMATHMDQILVLETQKNNDGKINYIKVHEIHYK